ncbi:MAG: hypothetical protein AAFO07_21510 [Bacteroidota bacterium]
MNEKTETILDDPSIPQETKIYFSRFNIFVYTVLGLGLLAYGIYLAMTGEWISLFIIPIALIFVYYARTQGTNSEPRIILNARGIKTESADFVIWEQIESIEAHVKGFGRDTKWHLSIHYKEPIKGKKEDHMLIGELMVTPDKIEKLIRIYQLRNKAQ